MRALRDVNQKISTTREDLAEYQAKLKHHIDEYRREKWAMFRGYIDQSTYGKLRNKGRIQRCYYQMAIAKKRKELAKLRIHKYELDALYALKQEQHEAVRKFTEGWSDELKDMFNRFYEDDHIL